MLDDIQPERQEETRITDKKKFQILAPAYM
jgi:hypothetical protein